MRSRGLLRRRRLGQHFLRDEKVIEEMARLANLTSRDVVIEVGAGEGVLTASLAERAGKVFAVEKDPKLYYALKTMFRYERRVEPLLGDALKISLPRYNKIVSSLPFSISSRFVLWLLKQDFEIAILLLQREFVEKLRALPNTPKYGRLSVLAASYFNIGVHGDVPSSSFTPRPKVDSTLISVTRKRPVQEMREEFFIDFVTALFSQRRKRLRAVVKEYVERALEGGKRNESIQYILYRDQPYI
ncbi:MAG: 16S rRNA (adenine(1518)-N(6)/adenine(1519)-N(6))-dimethyltransferase RsmA [Candidatus Bathyarchaeia archaeon]